jgi:5-methylcytosine-specific restriction endonuclease McrA
MTEKLPPTKGNRCGSRTGYNAHYQRGETPCADCKVAHRDYYIQWRKDNPEIVKASILRDRTLHKERYLQTSYRWAKNNPEKIKESNRKRRLKNPERDRVATRLRKARKKNVEHEKYTTQDILDTYGTVCYLCNKEIDLTANRKTGIGNWQYGLQLDHVIPISKGGSDTVSNVKPTHGICNLRKRDSSSLQ